MSMRTVLMEVGTGEFEKALTHWRCMILTPAKLALI